VAERKTTTPAEPATAETAPRKPARAAKPKVPAGEPAGTGAPARKSAAKSPPRAKRAVEFSADVRAQMIREAAYFMAEARGFVGGDPSQDWLAAEAQIDLQFSGGSQRRPPRSRGD
jgi:hypothetical protein